APASAGSRAAVADDQIALLVAYPAGEVFTVGLEGRHDVQHPFLIPSERHAAGADGAAVDHQRGAVQPAHGDHTSRHVFVAAGDGDQAVVPLGGDHCFDRVCDEVAGLQRIAHALGAHRNTIRYTDRVEPQPDESRGFDTLFYLFGEVIEVHVTRIAFPPVCRNADLGLVQVFGRESRTVQHGLGGSLASGLRDPAAIFIQGLCHD